MQAEFGKTTLPPTASKPKISNTDKSKLSSESANTASVELTANC